MKKYLLFSIIGLAVFAFATTAMANTCPTGTTPTPVETVIVPSDGSLVTSTNVLESGVTYLLEASGTFIYNSAGDWADAEWYLKSDVIVKGDIEGSKPYVLDISIDGYSINRDWGDYNPLHVYTMLLYGTGNSIDFSIYDSYSGDNSGSLTVDIDKCVDITAPVVTINSPTDGSFVSGTVNIYGSIVEEYELSHYNISVYPGDADFMDFSLRLEGSTVYQSTGFDNEQIYQWDTTIYEDGEYLVRLAARDKAGNRDLSGDPYLGGDDSQHVISVFVDNDDGILGNDDYCPGTVADMPTKGLGTNRWTWDGSEWITKSPKGEGPQKSFTMEDTRGCSCEQILETMDGKMSGHWKFGCSISVMEDFIASIQPVFVEAVEVYANNPISTLSNIELKDGVQYELEAIGTAYAGGHYTEDIEFDAEYSFTHSKVPDDTWTDAVTDYEIHGPTLLDLFVNGGSVDWGAYNTEHTYYYGVTGTGAPLELLIYDIYHPNNVGFITVNIYELP